MNKYNYAVLALLTLFVAGCANKGAPPAAKKTNEGRYKVTKDYGPESIVDVSHVKDAVPKHEPKSRGGNRAQYQVFGKSYKVLDSARGYKEQGGASWYGKKFHGYLTANGDKYDMYAMSAAHKSLPLPTYVQVTNLANQKKVVVRVNDRGPFHQGRIIDLSYAAASKLDMLGSGTAQVEVEAIDPDTWQGAPVANKTNIATKYEPSIAVSSKALVAPALKPQAPVVQAPVVQALAPATKKVEAPRLAPKKVVPKASALSDDPDVYKEVHYVQVAVFSNEPAAFEIAGKMKAFPIPALINEIQRDGRSLFKVLLGPVPRRSMTEEIKVRLEEMGYPGAHLVDLP